MRDETVWDPFCGSGLELIESALLGGVKKIFGTDISPEAIAITQANIAAAQLQDVQTQLVCCDFREHAKIAGLGPSSVTLIISNPPLGRRVRVPYLRGLFADLFSVAAQVLKPGGRLIFANPMRIEPLDASLKLKYREVVDLGGFDCRLEMYEKLAAPASRPAPIAARPIPAVARPAPTVARPMPAAARPSAPTPRATPVKRAPPAARAPRDKERWFSRVSR